jgi:hypothetical protein
MATDASDPLYVAFLPLSAYIWSHRMHMTPVCFLVPRSGRMGRVESLVAAWIRKAGGIVELVLPREHDRVSTYAQSVRLGAWALPYVDQDDYVVTADADIWPMSRTYWADAFDMDKDVTVLNGDFYRSQVHTDNSVPISYVGARADVWARMVGGHAGVVKDVAALYASSRGREQWYSPEFRSVAARAVGPPEVTAAILDMGRAEMGAESWDAPVVRGRITKHAQWYWDQLFMTRAFHAMGDLCPDRCKLGAGLARRRLDRGRWDFSGDVEEYSDAHLLRPLTDGGKWAKLMDVWRAMFGDTEWAEEFRRELEDALRADTAGRRRA